MPTVFITGGGGIIGPSLIDVFAGAGYNVISSYNHSQEQVEKALSAAEEKYGVKTLCLHADISVLEDIYAMFREAEATFGSLDCMVNNAGLTRHTNFLEATEENFAEIVHTDFRGTFFCMQQAAKNMLKYKKQGAIINISSNHQVVTFPNFSLYAASKAAVDRLTKSVSVELAPHGIRVVDIVPGYTDNEELEKGFIGQQWYKNICDTIPTHRYSLGSEIGQLAVFLASPAARNITGTHIFVDGSAQNTTGILG